MRLPTKEEFDALRFAIWNSFEIVLMLIAMAGVIAYSLRHIPRSGRNRKRLTAFGHSRCRPRQGLDGG
jgi:hypothetical protein